MMADNELLLAISSMLAQGVKPLFNDEGLTPFSVRNNLMRIGTTVPFLLNFFGKFHIMKL
ncbi:MAG: hypothetical protein NC124_06260 [Clostridium sp.]|nr:hypothetical protein [Clostridium sp.]